MRSTLFVLALLSVLAACGGGGGGGDADTTPAPPLSPDEQSAQIVQELLGSCGVDDVGNVLDYEQLLRDLLGPDAPAPDFEITGVNIIQASFAWSLDLDADQNADLIGTTQFQDASGSPTIPVTNVQDLLNALAGDLDAIGAVLAGAPAGTQIVTTYGGSPALLPATTIQGTLTVVLGEGGTIQSSSGTYGSETGGLCTSNIEWTDLDVSTVGAGGRPSGVLDVTATSPDNSLDGTLTLDGTNTGVLVVALDGAAPVTYTIDLTTGAITPAP
ncbi:MAG: hypothetical protein QNJ90_08890 [Planctomycetota bacterium]|nr:hypothetical protein [Planctomycetota bacterium]